MLLKLVGLINLRLVLSRLISFKAEKPMKVISPKERK